MAIKWWSLAKRKFPIGITLRARSPLKWPTWQASIENTAPRSVQVKWCSSWTITVTRGLEDATHDWISSWQIANSRQSPLKRWTFNQNPTLKSRDSLILRPFSAFRFSAVAESSNNSWCNQKNTPRTKKATWSTAGTTESDKTKKIR